MRCPSVAGNGYSVLPLGTKQGEVWMKVAQLLKNLAARVGYHVVRGRHNPAHTLTGLPHYQFGAVIDVGANSE